MRNGRIVAISAHPPGRVSNHSRRCRPTERTVCGRGCSRLVASSRPRRHVQLCSLFGPRALSVPQQGRQPYTPTAACAEAAARPQTAATSSIASPASRHGTPAAGPQGRVWGLPWPAASAREREATGAEHTPQRRAACTTAARWQAQAKRGTYEGLPPAPDSVRESIPLLQPRVQPPLKAAEEVPEEGGLNARVLRAIEVSAMVPKAQDDFVGSAAHVQMATLLPSGAETAGIGLQQGGDTWLEVRGRRLTASSVASATQLMPRCVKSSLPLFQRAPAELRHQCACHPPKCQLSRTSSARAAT